MPIPTPRQAMMYHVACYEGLYGDTAADAMNHFDGRIVGTMRGVTPAAAQMHFKVPASEITPEFMQTRVTLEVAGDIAKQHFYDGWFSPLVWNACCDVALDFGWGTGPGQAVKSTERDFLGLDNADFKFDPRSIAAWAARVDRDGVEKMVRAYFDVRENFYDLICDRNETLRQFRQGWRNRSLSMLPGTEWWELWNGGDVEAAIARADARLSNPLPRVVSKGMYGADVKRIQLALIGMGYLPDGSADGAFGPKTDEAVRKLQADKGLTVDGWVGGQTRAALGLT